MSVFINIAYVALTTLVFLIARSLFSGLVAKSGAHNRNAPERIKYVQKTCDIALILLYVTAVCVVLGLNYGRLTIFLSSAFAVIGVALFAQWSILSNITASIIIFFSFPYRIGDRICIVDGDEDLSGRIVDVTLFHVLIRRKNSDLVTYPNSLILQKAVIMPAGDGAAHDTAPLKSSDQAPAVSTETPPP